MNPRSVLIVAGEESGDVMAAAVLRRIDAPAFGMGGAALRAAGLDAVAHVQDGSVMGAGTVLRLPRLLRVAARLEAAVRARRPQAALLVGFSAFNARLGRRLRARGVRVLWYSPPQVWAWMPSRAQRLVPSADEMAVILPFEQPLWQRAGAVARFVGHPSVDVAFPGAPEDRRWLTLLPGSRDSEVRHHLPAMLGAAGASPVPVQAVLASSLSPRVRRWARSRLSRTRIALATDSLQAALARSVAAVVASGTATADCVAMRTPPIIVYRTNRPTWEVARRVVNVPNIGLPNIVLGDRVFPELLQGDVTPRRIAEALRTVARDAERYQSACDAARTALRGPSAASSLVADRLLSWLGDRSDT